MVAPRRQPPSRRTCAMPRRRTVPPHACARPRRAPYATTGPCRHGAGPPPRTPGRPRAARAPRRRPSGRLRRQADGLAEPEVADEPQQGLPVLEARRSAHEVEPGLGVVEPPVRPERLPPLVLCLRRHAPPDEE